MLTPEEKEWCHDMLVAMRIKNGAHQIIFCFSFFESYMINLN